MLNSNPANTRGLQTVCRKKIKMTAKYFSFLVLFLVLNTKADSASLTDNPYEFIMSYLGRNLAPSLYTFLDCFGDNEPWSCAKTKAGELFDKWDEDLQHQRRVWQEAADSEVSSSGRSIEEMPSKVGREVENSLVSLADMVQHGVARALSRKHHDDSGGIDSITISTGGGEKKKKMKKKKPPKIHLVHPVMMQMDEAKEDTRGFSSKAQSWVIGDVRTLDQSVNATPVRQGRGILAEMWSMGEKAIDAVSEHAVENDEVEDGIVDKSSDQEQRGKKKKKKKAILKLLILGAVLKAKIGTLLQILSFKLQVKFFLIALIGLAINLARFWIDLKNKHHQQPQKVIYYEHAQHQHHYDHEEEPAWGPWSRSMDPPEEPTDAEIDFDVQNIPYRAQIDRNTHQHPHAYTRPIIKRV